MSSLALSSSEEPLDFGEAAFAFLDADGEGDDFSFLVSLSAALTRCRIKA